MWISVILLICETGFQGSLHMKRIVQVAAPAYLLLLPKWADSVPLNWLLTFCKRLHTSETMAFMLTLHSIGTCMCVCEGVVSLPRSPLMSWPWLQGRSHGGLIATFQTKAAWIWKRGFECAYSHANITRWDLYIYWQKWARRWLQQYSCQTN